MKLVKAVKALDGDVGLQELSETCGKNDVLHGRAKADLRWLDNVESRSVKMREIGTVCKILA